MSIILNKPMELTFNEIEIDEYLPSIKFAFNGRIRQFSHEVQYTGDGWVMCSQWDEFVKNLSSSSLAKLSDIDSNFTIEMTLDKFHWSIIRKSLTGNAFEVKYSAAIDNDIFSLIKEQFVSYPRWW